MIVKIKEIFIYIVIHFETACTHIVVRGRLMRQMKVESSDMPNSSAFVSLLWVQEGSSWF